MGYYQEYGSLGVMEELLWHPSEAQASEAATSSGSHDRQ
jgi:hypothetical protein